LPKHNVINIFVQILDTIQFAYDNNIIRQHIKTYNIPIIIYGIIKIINQYFAPLTRAGSKLSTIIYISPVQIKRQIVSKSSNIYVLSVVLFEILTKQIVHNTNTSNERKIHKRITKVILSKTKNIYPVVNNSVQYFIDSTTAKSYWNRFKSYSSLKKAALLNLLN